MLPGGGAFCKEKGADGRMQPRSWKGDLGPYLPPRVREMLASVDEDAPLEEIRLRAGQPLQLCFTGCERLIYAVGGRPAVSAQDCADTLSRVCEQSLYAWEEELKSGFVTLPGGYRVGVCGRAVGHDGVPARLTDVTSLNFRISRAVEGAALPVLPLLADGAGLPRSTLVLSAPGCGKTTLINLLMRFYDLNEGNIYVDGVNAKDIPLDEYRKLFGMVLQESFLSGETVAYNVSYGAEHASREEIERAAKAAYCDYFIRNLENGYDTRLNDNINISQGEKQLICIARVMLVNPPMLILDEATSNIDTMTEMRIQKAFKKIMQGKTSFIVAHRLSTILDADLILVMNQGSVIEQGTHAELLAKQGFYYRLYNSQFAKNE